MPDVTQVKMRKQGYKQVVHSENGRIMKRYIALYKPTESS